MSRPGYSTSAVIQVQKGAPAMLLIGTDLLSQLGYFFIQMTEDSRDCDLLTTESSSNDDSSGSISQEVQSNEENDSVIESDIEGEFVGTVDQQEEINLVSKSSSSGAGIVCLVQATRISARHKKIIQVKETDTKFCGDTLTMFEFNSDMMDNYQLFAPSSLTCLDQSSQFTMVLENHGCEPVNLQPGQMLGRVEEVEVCLQDQSWNGENTDEFMPAVNTLLVDTVRRHYCRCSWKKG